MEKIIVKICAILLVVAGIETCRYSKYLAEAITQFYKNYPIVRYASNRQFKCNAKLIIVFGILLFLIGVVALLG